MVRILHRINEFPGKSGIENDIPVCIQQYTLPTAKARKAPIRCTTKTLVSWRNKIKL
jgi:hypothetical protein